jgi:hypothetical protein
MEENNCLTIINNDNEVIPVFPFDDMKLDRETSTLYDDKGNIIGKAAIIGPFLKIFSLKATVDLQERIIALNKKHSFNA